MTADEYPAAPEQPNREGIELVPGLARVAASAWWHTGVWAAETSAKASRRAVGMVLKPESALEFAREVTDETSRIMRAVAEVTDLDRRLDGVPGSSLIRRAAGLVPAPEQPASTAEQAAAAATEQSERASVSRRASASKLREGGEDLLRRSRDVRHEVDAHPAYARILNELAPDEGRILRLLLFDGPQAVVDVRTGGPMGLVRSHLIAPGMSMIGPRAGCRYNDRVPSYLNNLFRLGLIWFSRETLRDHKRYQVLEAQPDVLAAIHSVTAAKVVRRSIHLTPFGEDFCRVCLTELSPQMAALPEHSAPKHIDNTPQPPAEVLDA